MLMPKSTGRWNLWSVWLAGGLLLLAAMAPSVAQANAVITNGETAMGVNPHGHHNVLKDVAPLPPGFDDPRGNAFTGLLRNGVGDGTSPGCQCEGWGAAVTLMDGSRVAGTASMDNFPGVSGLGSATFGSTASTATSVVSLIDAPLEIRHEYGPSLAPDVIMGRVTISNTGSELLSDLVYRRTMDWDIPPTEFAEFVTHSGVAANLESVGGNVRLAHNNGFNTVDPRFDDGEIFAPQGSTTNVDFDKFGPSDHGSNFDFAFGNVLPGESRVFDIFYGTAPNEAGALERVSLLGLDVYSLGFSTLGFEGFDFESPLGDTAPCTDCPVFLFGFNGVGGSEPGLTPDDPVLPFFPAPGEFEFPAPTPRRWFDPPFAHGFEYSLSAGAFLEVGLSPTLFPGIHDIPYGPVDLSIGGITVASLSPGSSHVFGAGVTSFSITGITPLIDIADPAFGNSFPTFLDFTVVSGQTLSMTALEAVASPAPVVPEPSSILLLGTGLANLAFYRRYRRAG